MKYATAIKDVSNKEMGQERVVEVECVGAIPTYTVCSLVL